MKKTVAKIVCNGHYRVVYDDAKREYPYTVYYEWYDKGNHSRSIAHYADLKNCMYRIAEEVEQH